MRRFADYIFAIAATLWVGALWAIGAIAAPTLFHTIADRGLAGAIAGRLFMTVAWLGIGCAAYLLIYLLVSDGGRVLRSAAFWLVFAMLLLTLAGHFGVRPIIANLRIELAREMVEGLVRDRFTTWHGVSSALYLLQSALGMVLVTRLFSRR